MGWILYDEDPLADESIEIPLGLPRRIVFLSVGAVLATIGFTSTAFFQILSKTNNDLRQRGRYLVTGQGYTASVMTTVVFIYQAFRYRFPCFVLFWAWRLMTRYDRSLAIYEAPFSVPDEEDTMPDMQQTATLGMVTSITDSTASSNTAVTNSGDSTRAKVSTEQSPEEAALAKRWYKRYWDVTDRRALRILLTVYGTILAMALGFQIHHQLHGHNLSIYNPTSFNCHQSYEYYPAQLIAVVFIFVFSPAIIYRLRNYKDGFGIRKDLMAVSAMGIPGIVLFVIVPMYAPEFSDVYLDRTTWMATVFTLSHIFAVIIPLVQFTIGTSDRYASEDVKANAEKCRKTKRIIPQASMSTAAMGEGSSGHSGQASMDPSTRQRLHDIALETMRMSPNAMGAGVGTSHISSSNSSHHSSNRLQPSIDGSQRRPSRAAGSANFSFWSRATDDSMRYDWGAFVKALEDPEVFDKINAFTVGEFCSENTRFLAELSRLEKRAQRYERLRSMTVTGGGSWMNLSTAAAVGGAGAVAAAAATTATANAGGRSAIHPNNGTADSRQPYRFPPSDIEMGSSERIDAYDPNSGSGGSRHRIKKIVSVSSVSSAMPMLAGTSSYSRGRSSLSLDDFSEPPSPLGLPPVIRAPGATQSIRPSPTLDSLRTILPPSNEATEEKLMEEDEIEGRMFHDGSTLASPTAASETTIRPMELQQQQQQSVRDGEGEAMSLAESAMAPLPMPPTLLIQFQNIYKTFIRHGGRLELNLSHNTYTEIAGMAKRGEWRADMFER
ncbi:hypothetical protein BGZ73_001626 [Actinomortierella ambigua]|nr:hypothetical protein BGZ73_001626 [Actinomortierella ambigua]